MLCTPDIANYANSSAAVNRRYADTWGYGFHVVDHIVDPTRVPHWSKIHAVQFFLPDYDFLLWIDADAVFWDHSRRIEDVLQVDPASAYEIWAQDIWPDYPSIHRNELIDTGVVLFRNSLWARQFLTEMYYHPDCAEVLNWTEQYCFTVVYRQDFMGMRGRVRILPTPTVNHHLLPHPANESGMFIFHLAGRKGPVRAWHFKMVHEGWHRRFLDPQYDSFWRFRDLFETHRFAGVASLQACAFGLGERHRSFLEGLLFHFPYIGTFTAVLQGQPGLWTEMKATETIGERYPKRMAHIDMREYISGRTREGDNFVGGFFCDIFVLGVDSWRHLPSLEPLGRLARAGLEALEGDKNFAMGFSALLDSYFVLLNEGCTEANPTPNGFPGPDPGVVLDSNDEDGEAMIAACENLGQVSQYLLAVLGEHKMSRTESMRKLPSATPTLWDINAPGDVGMLRLGDVSLARVPRDAFPF